MKPEEQVRADFEAWHTLEFGSCDWHNTNHANRWIGYQAAYAKARREALEEAAESLQKQWEAESAFRDSKPGSSYHEGAADALDVAEHVIRDLIKD